MNRILTFLRIYPASLLIIFVYILLFCNLQSFANSWVNTEAFSIKAYILENGRQSRAEDLKRSLNVEKFEFAPRPTRVLSSYLDLIDTKFRSWLWQFVAPIPSLSLSWLFSIGLAPFLLFLLLRRWEVEVNTALAAVAFYLSTPGVLSGVFMLFRSAKPMTNAAIIACLFLASVIERRLIRKQKAAGLYIILMAAVFLSMFWDESAVLLYPAIILLFPTILLWKRCFLAWISIPILYAFSCLVILPKMVIWAGFNNAPVLNYHMMSMGYFRWRDFLDTFYINASLLVNENLGIGPLFNSAPGYVKVLALFNCIWIAVITVLFVRQCLMRFREGKGVFNSENLRWAGLLVILVTAHCYLVSISNYVWGPFYYGAYCSVFFAIFGAQVLKKIRLPARWLVTGSFLMICVLHITFLETNRIYKKVHFYPYEPLQMRLVYLGEWDRFDPLIRSPFTAPQLKEQARSYWEKRNEARQELAGFQLAKELFWLRIEMNPGEYRLCGEKDQAVCHESKDVLVPK